jgi:exonuclease VII small subunit
MNQLRKQTISVRQQIEAKTESLTSIINDIQSGKKTLPQDMLDELLLKSQNINSDTDSVKATSEISKEVSDTQDKVNKQDFNNALSSLDKVISRLQARLDALNKLNADLDGLLAIANMAVAPAPVDSTSPVQDQTGTSTTSESNTVTNTAEVSSSTN